MREGRDIAEGRLTEDGLMSQGQSWPLYPLIDPFTCNPQVASGKGTPMMPRCPEIHPTLGFLLYGGGDLT